MFLDTVMYFHANLILIVSYVDEFKREAQFTML